MRYMVALQFLLYKAIFWLIPVLYSKLVLQTFYQCNFSNNFYIISLFCKFTLPSMINSICRSVCLIFSCHLAAFISGTSRLFLRSFCICLLTLIFSISRLDQQISISYTSPNLLALIFYKCFFYILSNILAYIQNFSISCNCIYVYENVVK